MTLESKGHVIFTVGVAGPSETCGDMDDNHVATKRSSNLCYSFHDIYKTMKIKYVGGFTGKGGVMG